MSIFVIFLGQLQITTTHSKMDEFADAFDALDRQTKRNWSKVARDFKIDRMTLQRRYEGKCVSRQEANAKHRQHLNDIEEDMLLRYIDKLTNRHFLPTI